MAPSLPRRLVEPSRHRLAIDDPDRAAILAAHRDALEKGLEGYIDPVTGYWVFTAAFLWNRGYCCDSGCRHCPYIAR